ncbi:MAG: penicillin acylase family protein [Croceitalea sp.]|nr:penicillin acylase family protein [Croceitalea sp.]NNM17234.1 penicillin acylase family protein [Croceitalea sp.]
MNVIPLFKRFLLFLLVAISMYSCKESKKEQIEIEGLLEQVEIVRDKWGINHIYANNQHDLFFAQGYAAAQDRLFQFELWRRQATGTVAEILGERELNRDIGTRLFKFRGDMTEEMNHYHEDGAAIITAYTNGVNAYIDRIMKTPGQLPIEFKMLNIVPEKWTPEVVISRHQGLLGNIQDELEIGRAVALLGEESVKDLYWFHPKEPNISIDSKIDKNLLFDDILALYTAYRKPVRFEPEDVLPEYRATSNSPITLNTEEPKEDSRSIGSNNWVVSGKHMENGKTFMANDPHRRVALPSLRYMAHLVAPGWNVIGGGEPEIPGISIGHNEYGSWGLTVFETDGEDLYVYDLNPDDKSQYRYQDEWTNMMIIQEKIPIKNSDSIVVDLSYTHHGPVAYLDTINNKAYAVRCAWLEPGGSPYLASLRMDQAKTWEEFREACNYSHIPGENMVWADKEGIIGWQAVGIAPIRQNFSGLVPVPGDGTYEWDGYLPIIEKPNILNPPQGFIATANQNVTPQDYDKWNAIGHTWADPYRGDRVNEVLESNKKPTMATMKALQVDYLSLPARALTPFLSNLSFVGKVQEAKLKLEGWDYRLHASSIEAAIYVAWENEIKLLANKRFIPEAAQHIISGIQLKKLMDWIQNPDSRFGYNPIQGRNAFLTEAFENAIQYLNETLGDDINMWQYGQEKFKHSYISHPLGGLVSEKLKEKLNLGPLPRGGNGYTPGSTGSNNRQSSGATFRMIVDTGDWDTAIGTNGPGQSGDPGSPFYSNLFESWANDEYFPVFYSRSKIDSVMVSKKVMMPKR